MTGKTFNRLQWTLVIGGAAAIAISRIANADDVDGCKLEGEYAVHYTLESGNCPEFPDETFNVDNRTVNGQAIECSAWGMESLRPLGLCVVRFRTTCSEMGLEVSGDRKLLKTSSGFVGSYDVDAPGFCTGSYRLEATEQ